MKKIINGKLYNTETAKEIDRWSNNLSGRDFNHCTECLYRKKTGEFFLYGWGGPMSKYRERCGDMWGDGEAITPLTEEEAKAWVEEHSDADTYIDLFMFSTANSEAEDILFELKHTYDYLETSDMDEDDAGDRRHLRAVRRAINFIEEMIKETKGE